MSHATRRVLIAEDEEIVRWGVRAVLEACGDVEVVAEAASGRIALEEARRTHPDIAIVDYSMPDMNGVDLIVALKRELPRTEILLYSVYESEKLVLEVLRAGGRGYVPKSDTETHLLPAIDALSMHQPYFSDRIPQALLEHLLDSSPVAGKTS